MRKATRIFLGLLLVAFVSVSTRAEVPDLAGTYTCKGTNNGVNYEGTVVLKKVREGYHLKWNVANDSYEGVGFIDDGKLSVAWITKTPNGVAIGVITYKIEEKKKLVGKWIDQSMNAIHTETLRPKVDLQAI